MDIRGGQMSEVMSFTLLDMAYCSAIMLISMIVYAVVKSYFDNKKFEKHIYKVVENYRAKYGVDNGCEMLLYLKNNPDKRNKRKWYWR